MTFTLYSSQWKDLGPCYSTKDCTDNLETKQMTYMGCTITIYYHRLVCGSSYYYQIDDITYFGDAGCVNLHLYLHPQGQAIPDAGRFFKMMRDVYKMLFDDYFHFVQNNYICPNYMEFNYWWPGDCSMACETILANGNHIWTVHSCQALACCGKRFVYCYDPQQQKAVVHENTYWVGTACPPQTYPDSSKCPTVGNYIGGILITAVNTTYCISTCHND